jgi:hypothetical protein
MFAIAQTAGPVLGPGQRVAGDRRKMCFRHIGRAFGRSERRARDHRHHHRHAGRADLLVLEVEHARLALRRDQRVAQQMIKFMKQVPLGAARSHAITNARKGHRGLPCRRRRQTRRPTIQRTDTPVHARPAQNAYRPNERFSRWRILRRLLSDPLFHEDEAMAKARPQQTKLVGSSPRFQTASSRECGFPAPPAMLTTRL